MDWQEQQELEKKQLAELEKQLAESREYRGAMVKPNKTRLPIELPDTDDVRELARAATPQAIRALVDIVQDVEASDNARISAASALLDRAHGKPHQSVDMQAAIKHMFEPLVIRAAGDDAKLIEG